MSADAGVGLDHYRSYQKAVTMSLGRVPHPIHREKISGLGWDLERVLTFRTGVRRERIFCQVYCLGIHSRAVVISHPAFIARLQGGPSKLGQCGLIRHFAEVCAVPVNLPHSGTIVPRVWRIARTYQRARQCLKSRPLALLERHALIVSANQGLWPIVEDGIGPACARS